MTQSKMDIDMQMHFHYVWLRLTVIIWLISTAAFQFMSFDLHTTQTTHTQYTIRCMFYYNDKLEFKRHRRQRHSIMMTTIFKVKQKRAEKKGERKSNSWKYLDQKSQSWIQDFGFNLRYEICQFIAINIAKRVRNWFFILSE